MVRDFIGELRSKDAEIERLKDRVRQLEQAYGVSSLIPHQFNLSKFEAKLMLCLMRWPIVTVETALAAMYGNRNHVPEENIVRVVMRRIRIKLKPHGIEIVTKWGGGGYLLTLAAKDKIRIIALSGDSGEKPT